ncbi:MAG: zinc/manganese transport system substrate-binding protein [Thermoanaerobaculia bacterium]|jgi:ABC-type Zn uptake system ZnuABC Zn-binding protein ZnuA|nr:zinc/manganese transport system substrate-binding protein [Thermoanaerobaculia bacterium]
MKRIILLIASLALATSTFAADKLKVVTTTEDLASLAREVGGDHVEVASIGKGYQDPHFIEPKPSFLLLLKNADLLVVVGLELEIGWLPPLLDQSRNNNVRPGAPGYLDVSQGVEILERPTGAVNRSMGDVHPSGNPHYWLDPANAVRMAIQIRNRLAQLRPADAGYFDQRLNDFKLRINEANKRWLAALAPYKGTKIITYHSSWPNFTRHFGLDVVGFVEPKPGIPPSPSHTLDLINLMKAQKVKVILMEPYFDRKTPDFIAERSGAQVVVMYPSVGGAPGLDDYLKLFDRNIADLIKALK